MSVAIIPREAKAVPCPNCGRILRNLALLGVKRQVACLCGTIVVIERRASEARVEAADRRKQSA